MFCDMELYFNDKNLLNNLALIKLDDEKNIPGDGAFSDEENISDSNLAYDEEDIGGYAALSDENTSIFKDTINNHKEKKPVAKDPPSHIHSSPSYAYIYKQVDHYFFLTDIEGDTLLTELEEKTDDKNYLIKIDYKAYLNALKKKQIRLNPIIEKREIVIGALTSDAGWQTACQLTEELAKQQSWDIATQLGFPIVLGAIAGMLKIIVAIKDYKKEHRSSSIPIEIEKAIYSDCFKFCTKTAVAMGAWELGYFIGQCVITAASLCPHSLWIPAILAIGAGLFQAINAVTSQITEDKYKFGYIKTSKLDLAKMFITSFVSGAVWQLCSYIPFGHVLAKTVIKPAAHIVGSILVGAVTGCCNYIINKVMPTTLTSTVMFFKSAEKKSSKPSDIKHTRLRPVSAIKG